MGSSLTKWEKAGYSIELGVFATQMVAHMVMWLFTKDASIQKGSHYLREMHLLVAGIGFFMAAMNGFFLVGHGSPYERPGDSVLVQVFRWAPGLILPTLLLGVETGTFLAMRGAWIAILGLTVMLIPGLMAIGAVLSAFGPATMGIWALIVTAAGLAVVIVKKRRNVDNRHWIVFLMEAIFPLFFAVGYVLGKPVLGEITNFDIEYILYFLGDLLVFAVTTNAMVFMYKNGTLIKKLNDRLSKLRDGRPGDETGSASDEELAKAQASGDAGTDTEAEEGNESEEEAEETGNETDDGGNAKVKFSIEGKNLKRRRKQGKQQRGGSGGSGNGSP